MKAQSITVQALVEAPVEKVWACYTKPEHIVKWNAASKDWHTPKAENDVRVGGRFVYRMEARDGSQGFDFGGTFTAVAAPKLLDYTIADGRAVHTTFEQKQDATQVTVMFQAETENTVAMQKKGWQAILDNFKKYVESSA